MSLYELPLFPLNTVLFPGMPLELHIFEERYRQMVTYCRVNNSPFGVILIKSGAEAHGPLAQPHSIGCTAQMAQLQPLSDGRYNMIAAGMDRFRIHSIQNDRPYLVGLVESLQLELYDSLECSRLVNELRPWLNRYISLVAPPDELVSILNYLPEEPVQFGYRAAAILQVSPSQKQAFLELETCPRLLSALMDMVRREIAIIQKLAETPARDQGRGFSIN